jgi:methyl-accepting chemotaxis protein
MERFSIKKAFWAFAIISSMMALLLLTINYDHSTGYQNLIVSITAFLLIQLVLAFIAGRHFAQRAELLVNALNQLADGNLTKKLKLTGRDDFAWLAYEYNSARKSLVKLVTDLSNQAGNISEFSSQLANASQEISVSTRKQSEAATSIAAAIEEVATSAVNVSENAQQAHLLTSEAGKASQAGTGVIGRVVEEVGNIAQAVQESSNTIEELGDQSSQIRSIVKVINDVAEQTNLLALNAAIEAARAGEQGRGFAVVADEVRKLAERTAESTKEISNMIESISAGTSQAVISMQEGVLKVENGVTLAQEAGTSITSIDEHTQRVVVTVSDISNAIDDQRKAVSDIARHVEQIAQMAESNAEISRSTDDAVSQLSTLSQSLQTSVARFRL